jgi:serine protease Do
MSMDDMNSTNDMENMSGTTENVTENVNPVTPEPENVIETPVTPEPQEVASEGAPIIEGTDSAWHNSESESAESAEPVNSPEPEYNADHTYHIVYPEGKTEDTSSEQQTSEAATATGVWSEPAYESAESHEDVYTPGHYAYGAQNSHEAEPAKKSKKKKKHGFLKAACLVLACAIAAGAGSAGVVSYMLKNHSEKYSGTQVVLGSPTTTVQSTSSSQDTTGVLTGSDIYNMAIEQVVGVNSSYTSSNIFGQTSTAAVSGSGFIISSDGYILTNYHVISYAVLQDSAITVLMYDGTSYEAKVVGYVEDNDVAVLKIDATGLNPVTLGDSDSMQVGEAVYAVGNPLGELDYTLTGGYVSALDRVITTSDEITGASTSMNMFQIDAAVNSGNSGGPVYNSRGEVIGIVTAKYSDSGVEGLGFAIPINDAVSLATQLIEQGYVSGAVLGVEVIDTSKAYSSFVLQYYGYPDGVCVMSVNSGSAAENAGIIRGDIITAINGKTITSTDELKLALRKFNPGDTTTITVYRVGQALGDGEYVDLEITFDAKSSDTTTETENTAATETETEEDTQQSQQQEQGQQSQQEQGQQSQQEQGQQSQQEQGQQSQQNPFGFGGRNYGG